MLVSRNTIRRAAVALAISICASCGPSVEDDAGPDCGDMSDAVEVENGVEEDTTLSGCVSAPDGLRVEEDVLLTIEPGTYIAFGADTQLIAVDGGKLKAEGTAEEPIVLTGEEEIPSYWIGVQFNGTNSTDNVLDHVTIEYAGQEASSFSNSKPAALDLNSWNGPVRVAIDNTTIRHSEEFGLRIDNDVTITSFSGNTIADNARAVRATPTGAGQLSGESSLGENENNVVEIAGDTISTEVTWPSLDGAEYLVRDRVRVDGEDDASGALTIEAGATVAFDQNAGLVALRGGTLTAQGTADSPIVFTGKEQTQGYWLGIHYNATNSTDNALEHATIEYAGGDGWASGYSGSSPANLLLNNWTGPVRVTLNDVVLRSSASSGLHVRENADDITIDGCSNVTFEDNAEADITPEEASCS